MAVREDIEFGTGSGRALRLDIVAPPAGVASQRTAVVQLHGGAWRLGSPKMIRLRAELLSRHGFVCLPAEYRLLGEAPWPAQIHDVKAAIRWTRANAAELGVEADRIVVQGFSAGGHLALLAAGTPGLAAFEGDGGNAGVSSAVAAVNAFYPVTTFFDVGPDAPTDLDSLRALRRADGATPAPMLLAGGAGPEGAAAASPSTYVSAAFPPTLLMHGLADPIVVPATSLAFHEALLAAGAVSELHTFAGQIHEFDAAPTMCDVTQHLAAVFFRRLLSEPELFAADQAAHNPFLQPRPT